MEPQKHPDVTAARGRTAALRTEAIARAFAAELDAQAHGDVSRKIAANVAAIVVATAEIRAQAPDFEEVKGIQEEASRAIADSRAHLELEIAQVKKAYDDPLVVETVSADLIALEMGAMTLATVEALVRVEDLAQRAWRNALETMDARGVAA